MSKKESCSKKLALLTAWHTAAETYSKSVAELSRKVGTLSNADYEELKRKAEEARRLSVAAQEALDAHVDVHGCKGNGEKAA